MKINILIIASIAALCLASCKKDAKLEVKSKVKKVTKRNIATNNLLIGSWVQTNPINDKEIQGFTINVDSSAVSINMATLVYKKWWLIDKKLYLVAESIGNRSTSIDTIKYDIVTNTTDSLVLKNGNSIDKYLKKE